MVRLDLGGVLGARLDDVGIQGALYEEAGVLEVDGDLFEDADEGLADDLALALGIGDVVQRLEETVARLDVHEVDGKLFAERLLDLLGLTEAQQSGVDEHARELVADRLVHERGRNG